MKAIANDWSDTIKKTVSENALNLIGFINLSFLLS